eukprot:TRINITY_DN7403_c0_g1_i8.p1 TRINITY_DN7403_c0_g1~~TRINITY_DN7403_c0_g1_i8.p1  ORF type:complete len:106 (+),score=12.86 TRINITY_DN7403_c0_g1_i8:84-401(+)
MKKMKQFQLQTDFDLSFKFQGDSSASLACFISSAVGKNILLHSFHILQLSLVKLLHSKHSHIMLSSRVLHRGDILEPLGVCSLDSRQQLRGRLALRHDQGGVGSC